MSLTGEELLQYFSEFLDDWHSSTSTSVGTTTTLVDTALQRFGEKANEEAFLRITEESATPGNLYLVRRITNFTGSTITFAPALPQSVASGIDYQIHRWDPAKKFRALDRARILAFPQVAKIIVDETVTSDGHNIELNIPSSIRRGPAQVWAEDPLSPTVDWNMLANPQLSSQTGWTRTGTTVTVYNKTVNDNIVPKLEQSCLKLSGGASGYIFQDMSSTVAAAMAGRRMTFGVWLYSQTSGPRIAIADDSGSSYSDPHNGGGWEFLQVSRVIYGANATLLRVYIYAVTANAIFVERAYLGQLDRIALNYRLLIPRDGIHRDDNDHIVYLKRPAPRGYQYRMVGRTPITALGTNALTQTTNSMEVDEEDMDLLLATAARILLTWEGMSSGEIEKTFPMVAIAEQRFKELQEDWRRRYPKAGYIQIDTR